VVAATFLGDLAAVHDDETEVAESNDIKAAHGSVFVQSLCGLICVPPPPGENVTGRT
jgi:hypothetical protein